MQVLLIHGMGRTPLSMLRLGRRLSRKGHTFQLFGYLAAVEPFARIVRRLRDTCTRLGTAGPYVIVGHSLGGLLARAALGAVPVSFRMPAHLIMLGTPNQPPRQARRYGGLLPYRWINGECGQLLMQQEFFSRLPPIAIRHTIVAGTRAGLDRRVFGNDPNDGLVAVNETMITPTDRPVTVPAWHTFIMNDARVRDLIIGLLGRLERDPAQPGK